MSDDDPTRLRHMLDASRAAMEFARAETRESLDNDLKLVFALVRAVEIIGEAASKITREFQTANPQIPWSAIVGMRDRLVHAYFDVDLDAVWSTVTDDLPPLIAELEKTVPPDSDDPKSSPTTNN